MPLLKPTTVVLLLTVLATASMAQNTRPKPVTKPKEAIVQKFKPPKLKTSLGGVADSAKTVSVDEALRLIEAPLTITDDKKTVYIIASYQCMYKRKGVTENEESGKVSPITSVVAQVFKTTPLSEIWRKTIYEQLKAGEEIYFFDIVVKDTQGHLMFAPALKLLVN